jgi:hypothetical protein
MKQYFYSVLSLLFLVGSCSSNSGSVKNESKPASSVASDSLSTGTNRSQSLDKGASVLNTKEYTGVIIINSKAQFSDGFDFMIYNQDKTLWKKVRFSPSLVSADVKPYMFNYDNFLLIFKCIDKNGEFFKVVVNEATSTLKLISTNEKNLVFHTWEQHILNDVFSVDFKLTQNPLREKPEVKSSSKPASKYQVYHPTKIEGDWLKVKDDEGKEGWIKWRDEKGVLLVNLFFDA